MNVRIVDSRNACAANLQGAVVDETRNTLVIQTNDGKRKKLVKSHHTFELDGTRVPGAVLEGRPEERIKRWIRKKA